MNLDSIVYYNNVFLFSLDRKKDLLKLAHGEYVSLGKVESALKQSSYVENCCAYGDSNESHIILLVVPVPAALEKLAEELGETGSFEEQCENKTIVQKVLADIQSLGKKSMLHLKFYLIRNAYVMSAT